MGGEGLTLGDDVAAEARRRGGGGEAEGWAGGDGDGGQGGLGRVFVTVGDLLADGGGDFLGGGESARGKATARM